MIGKRFGRLTVLKELKRRGGSGEKRYECKCVCGTRHKTAGTRLRSGHTKSCGCLSVDTGRKLAAKYAKATAYKKRKAPGHRGLTYLLNTYQAAARKRDRAWKLTREEFKHLTSSACYYCNKPPNRKVSPGRTSAGRVNATYIYNGIDRVDSKGGYTTDNCVPCCAECNEIKMDWDTTELFEHLSTMLEVYNKRRMRCT